MKGLRIKDSVAWRESWSAKIGKTLLIADSTFDLLVFDERHDKADILAVIGEAPAHCYEIVDLEAVPQEYCEFVADSGKCYRRKG